LIQEGVLMAPGDGAIWPGWYSRRRHAVLGYFPWWNATTEPVANITPEDSAGSFTAPSYPTASAKPGPLTFEATASPLGRLYQAMVFHG